jgi:hypothetical protein
MVTVISAPLARQAAQQEPLVVWQEQAQEG